MLTQNNRLLGFIRNNTLLIGLLLLMLVLQALPISTFLRFERDALLLGQLWRALSGHLVHLGWSHFMLNAAGLVVIWLLFGQSQSAIMWLWHCLLISLLISVGFIILNPELQWYVGFSGVLHGIFVVGMLAQRFYRDKWLVVVMLGFIAKLLWEQLSGPLPGSEVTAGGNVVVDAHLYGAVAGVFAYYGLTMVCARINARIKA